MKSELLTALLDLHYNGPGARVRNVAEWAIQEIERLEKLVEQNDIEVATEFARMERPVTRYSPQIRIEAGQQVALMCADPDGAWCEYRERPAHSR